LPFTENEAIGDLPEVGQAGIILRPLNKVFRLTIEQSFEIQKFETGAGPAAGEVT
jgi:hypothetical protein